MAEPKDPEDIAPMFKLRLGAQAPAPAPPPAPVPEPSAPTEWEEFPASVRQDEAREYKTDSDFQAMLNQLASKITETSGTPVRHHLEPATTTSGRAPSRTEQTARALAKLRPDRSDAPAAPTASTSDRSTSDRSTSDPSTPDPSISVTTVAPDAVAQPILAESALAEPPEREAATAAMGSVEPSAAKPAMEEQPVSEPQQMTIVPATPDPPSAGAAPDVVAAAASPSHAGLAEPPMVTVTATPRPVVQPLPPAAKVDRSESARPTAPKQVNFHELLKTQGIDAPSVKKRKQRHPFRVMFKLVLVLALAGGGAYAAKKYYFDVQWAKDVRGLADDVAARRGLAWDDAVPVVELPTNEYSLRLASSMLMIQPADSVTLSAEWRAMGLAEHGVDLVAVGAAALADQPAFYDPMDRTIYQLSGISPTLRDVALSRALANALLDQHHHWGDVLRGTADGSVIDPSVAFGTRALFDGDALSIRAATVDAELADPTLATTVSEEIAALRLDVAPIAQGASPYGVALTASAGVAARGLFTGEMTPSVENRDRAEEIAVDSDASVFDAARGRSAQPSRPTLADPVTTSVPETAAAVPPPSADVTVPATVPPTVPTTALTGSTTRGLIYWYYVLAGRLDPAVAWDAAVRWQGDGTLLHREGNDQCVDATVVTTAGADHDVMLAALGSWAEGAPAGAQASVTSLNDEAITVHSCDPGTGADTYTNDVVPVFGQAPTEMIVASGLIAAGLPRTEAARSCVVRTVRSIGAPPLLQSTTLDSSLTAPTLDQTSTQVRDLIATCANA